MILPRPDLQSLAWRLPLLVIAIAALVYSSVRSVEFNSDGSMINRTGEPFREPGFGELSLIQKEYKSVAEHPLFEPSRKPWSPPKRIAQTTSSQAIVPPAPIGYTLVGLVLSAGQHAALLRDNVGKTRIVLEGSTIDGWSVRYIDQIGVHLYFGNNIIHMTMHKQGH